MKGSLYNKVKRSIEVSQHNKGDQKVNKLLITVNILGSSGPLRFLVKEDDLVCEVIRIALKSYAREGRLPLLDMDATNFLLYCTHTEEVDGALSPREQIGSKQARNFVLCKKEGTPSSPLPNKKMKRLRTIKESHGNINLKTWINKLALSFKISSHCDVS